MPVISACDDRLCVQITRRISRTASRPGLPGRAVDDHVSFRFMLKLYKLSPALIAECLFFRGNLRRGGKIDEDLLTHRAALWPEDRGARWCQAKF